MSAKQKTCPGCQTAAIAAKSLWCSACWKKVPKKLREMFRSSTLRGASIPKIHDFFRREREEPKML